MKNNIERFFGGATVTETDIFQQIKEDLYSPKVQAELQKIDTKRANDWAYLANRTVGHE
ncbi:MAG: hypothetical protein PHH54_03710 [Candidatus Nanoarchaeia archaeon]|nr:hypothetical protein [Candidatus Nanoarchaeia archaeon]MDD5741065.1 hypothetical protein [Candidatus Nanoarchaeia archaeon]